MPRHKKYHGFPEDYHKGYGSQLDAIIQDLSCLMSATSKHYQQKHPLQRYLGRAQENLLKAVNQFSLAAEREHGDSFKIRWYYKSIHDPAEEAEE
ncbi:MULTISPECIES: hypothetical protein [Marispirochaeta]|uniref:hypothetical protein n=1 Tax=Marispirochaeta TaxID=1911565 RepID=UPI0029C7C5CE|nr:MULTISPECIES: hypothetical protein [Marispirochaeta]